MVKPAPPAPPPGKKTVTYMELYKYSTPNERLVVILGIISSLAAGLVLPTYAILVGKVVEIFDPRFTPEE